MLYLQASLSLVTLHTHTILQNFTTGKISEPYYPRYLIWNLFLIRNLFPQGILVSWTLDYLTNIHLSLNMKALFLQLLNSLGTWSTCKFKRLWCTLERSTVIVQLNELLKFINHWWVNCLIKRHHVAWRENPGNRVLIWLELFSKVQNYSSNPSTWNITQYKEPRE